jgi:hypothetical protein
MRILLDIPAKLLALLLAPDTNKCRGTNKCPAGKQKTLALGTYPDVKLVAARKKRLAARELLDANKDPGLVKKEYKRQ